MKTKEELKEWFWDLYNSCYVVEHDNHFLSDILFYDENFIRQAKLKTILDEDIIYPTKPNGVCLFELAWVGNYIKIDNYIWLVLQTELGYNSTETKYLIKGWFKDHKLNGIDIYHMITNDIPWHQEYDKLKVLTPHSEKQWIM